jgi:Domain of unknown function (DUF2382)
MLIHKLILEPLVIFDRSRDPQQQQPLESQIADPSNILTSEIFYLLEERLMVDLTRHKIGEIVVRKEIDTQILQVEVPVRHEKLIVEQVSPEYKLLARIDLGQEYVSNSTPAFVNNDDRMLVSSDPKSLPNDNDRHSHDLVSSQVNSPVAAIDLLTELAQIAGDDVQTIRISIALKDNCNRDRYHQLFTDKRQAEIGQEVG